MFVKFNLLDGRLPQKQTKGSAGYDLYSAIDTVIAPMCFSLIRLGFEMEIEEGFEAQIRSRSGLALKKQIFVLTSPGTIDSDYRGEVCAVLYNIGTQDFLVKKNDRIAQMIFAKYYDPVVILDDNLSKTSRTGGFGSTEGL